MGSPSYYAMGGLALALALALAWGFRVDTLRARHESAHQQTKRAYAEAQEKAQAAFQARIAAQQAHNRRLNDAADQKSDDLRIVYRDRVVRLPAAPARCAAGGVTVPDAGDATRVDGPGGDPVLLERADAVICAVNTARLQAAREWALGLAGSSGAGVR